MENEIKVTFDGEKAVACPVCYGRGFVPAGFYDSTGLTWVSTTTGNETCRSCGGKGYIKLSSYKNVKGRKIYENYI